MKDAVSHYIPYTTSKSRFYGDRKTTKPRNSTRNDSRSLGAISAKGKMNEGNPVVGALFVLFPLGHDSSRHPLM